MQLRASVQIWARHEKRDEMCKTGDSLAFSNINLNNGKFVKLRMWDGERCIEIVVKVSDLAEIVRIFGER